MKADAAGIGGGRDSAGGLPSGQILEPFDSWAEAQRVFEATGT
jgi:hypothetical protein